MLFRSDEIVVRHNASRLVTYADPSQIRRYWEASNNTPVFLDSGAFSAFTQKKEVDIDNYIEFIKQNLSRIEVYALLDVIGDPIGTKKNLEYMEARGLKPLPVFHVGGDLKELEEMCNKYNYLALGGLVPYAMNRAFLKSWLDNCFSITRDKTKVHGFGVNAVWAWKRYPFYSVDATSWLTGAKFARLQVGNKSHDKSSKTIMGMKLHTENHRVISEISLIDYLEKAKEVTRLWESRGVLWSQ